MSAKLKLEERIALIKLLWSNSGVLKISTIIDQLENRKTYITKSSLTRYIEDLKKLHFITCNNETIKLVSSIYNCSIIISRCGVHLKVVDLTLQVIYEINDWFNEKSIGKVSNADLNHSIKKCFEELFSKQTKYISSIVGVSFSLPGKVKDTFVISNVLGGKYQFSNIVNNTVYNYFSNKTNIKIHSHSFSALIAEQSTYSNEYCESMFLLHAGQRGVSGALLFSAKKESILFEHYVHTEIGDMIIRESAIKNKKFLDEIKLNPNIKKENNCFYFETIIVALLEKIKDDNSYSENDKIIFKAISNILAEFLYGFLKISDIKTVIFSGRIAKLLPEFCNDLQDDIAKMSPWGNEELKDIKYIPSKYGDKSIPIGSAICTFENHIKKMIKK